MARLGVNVDHVATVRQARRGAEPDPVYAAVLAELGGADQITIHLREDRRHIQDRDLRVMRDTIHLPLNLEMGLADDMVALALEIRPHGVTLVPENRREVTTEGGLDVIAHADRLAPVVERMLDAGIAVSAFIDPDPDQVESARALSFTAVELHTGRYANARDEAECAREIRALADAGRQVREGGQELRAGHGLNYRNVARLHAALEAAEYNIGHSIVARAVLVGMTRAVRDMKALVSQPAALAADGAP